MKNRKFWALMMMTLMVSAAAGCAEANTAAEPQEQTAQAGEDAGGNAPEETTGDSDAVKPEMRQEKKETEETEEAETEELKEAEQKGSWQPGRGRDILSRRGTVGRLDGYAVYAGWKAI